MVSYRERRTTALCAVAAGLLAVVCARWGLRPLPPLAVSPVHVHFEGSQALEYTRVMAEEFPDRVTGTLASHRAANYLCTGFHKLGCECLRSGIAGWRETICVLRRSSNVVEFGTKIRSIIDVISDFLFVPICFLQPELLVVSNFRL